MAFMFFSRNMDAAVVSFQHDVNGYVGTHDAEIAQDPANAGNNFGTNVSWSVDLDDPGGTQNDTQVLLKFTDIVGSGAGQIPSGETVNNARLRVYTTDPGAAGPMLHRMLATWDESTVTWNFFTDGVQADDIEANISLDATVPNADMDETFTEVDVTATVQAWVNGAVPNEGWVIFAAGNNGWDVASSENAITNRRPQLIVDYGALRPPMFTLHPSNTTVLQCRGTSMSVAVEGSQPISLQWYVENPPGSANFVPVDSFLNPTATNATLVITNAQPADGSTYFVQAVNASGFADSSQAVLTVTPDADGPVAIAAVASADRTQVTVSYNEPVLAWDMIGDVSTTAQDPFDYSIREVGNPGNFLVVQQNPPPAIQNGTNIVLTLDPGFRWMEGVQYEVEIFPDIPDACNQTRSAGQIIAISAPRAIRQDLNGYTGTEDTEIREAAPDAAAGQAASFTVDGDDGPPTGADAHGLLRFGNFVGSNPNQIPQGSVINSAMLRIVQNNPGNTLNVHRMLVAWNENVTWNSMSGGLQADGVEAATSPDFMIPEFSASGPLQFVVTAAVQAWVDNPSSNFGWALIPTGNDGFDMDSSEAVDVTTRPTLIVDFTVIPRPVGIPPGGQPPASITINEGDTLNISLVVTGSSPRFQWRQNDVDISGATAATYTKTNANANDNGTYRCIVSNQFNTVISDPCVVTVNADSSDPTVVSATGDPNMTTVRITYSEIMDPASAQNTGNYVFTPGLSVSSAVLSSDGRTMTLTTAARTFRQTYNLRISNVTDDALALNAIAPNPTDVQIRSDAQRISGFHDMWRYNTNCQDFLGWEMVNFPDEVNWSEGPGSFGVETTAGTEALLASEGAQIQTALLDPSPASVASYFRRSITVPSLDMSGGAVFVVRHFVDDGAIFYLDGTEAFRTVNMTNNPTSCTNLALDTPPGGDANLMTNTIALTPGSTHVIAAQVQQNSTGSSDVLFGAEILAILPPPTMTITYDGAANMVTVSWTPAGGQLEESADLVNWSNSSRANGIPAPPSGGHLFYRVSQ